MEINTACKYKTKSKDRLFEGNSVKKGLSLSKLIKERAHLILENYQLI